MTGIVLNPADGTTSVYATASIVRFLDHAPSGGLRVVVAAMIETRHSNDRVGARRVRGNVRRPQKWRTVAPSVIAGGSTVVLMFSFTHPAARREDSSVPALS
jgi:hypothetical protein